MDVRPVDLSAVREEYSLRPVGKPNYSRARYGLTESDTYAFDTYLAKVIANGLITLAATGHDPEERKAEYRDIAAKFYLWAEDDSIHEEVDYSQDEECDLEDYLNASDEERLRRWPGAEEFSRLADIRDKKKMKELRIALKWLRRNFTGLWD